MELEIFSPLHNDRVFFYFSTPTRKRGCTDDQVVQPVTETTFTVQTDHLCVQGPAPSLSCNLISCDDFHKVHVMGLDIKTLIALTATEICACWSTVAREGRGNEKHSHTWHSYLANKLS